uniref:bacterial Ig-like domain-containing protein n=1 Tax=uncultured Streptococcus sp. TaxID=83427 RepID=UPI0025989F91
TLLLSHTVLAPLTAVAQEQDTSPQQVQGTTDSNSNESVEAAQKEGAESIDDGKPDKTPQDASPQQVQGTTDSALNESAETAQRAVADPIDNWMPDKALQVAVAKALGLEVSKITKSDMLQLTVLHGDAAGIASLEGLQYASNLIRLDLHFNHVSDLTPLQHLSNLSSLGLNGNQVSDLTPLQHLSNLSVLNLYNNHVSDLTPLQHLSNLSVLYLGVRRLDSNHVSDLTPLQHLSNLSDLDLDNNQITDLTPLRDLSNLKQLNLNGNHISDLTPLQNLNLSTLYASRQTITLPTIYVLNKQPYSASVQTAIKNLNGTTPTISPQNNDTWTGVYNSGKVEWSSANQVPETGDLVLTWEADYGNVGGRDFRFSGKCVQPYVLSKASITAHNSTIYVGDNWQARDNFDSALDHDGNPLDFSKIAVSGTVDTSRPGVYSVVYSYDGLEEKVEVTVEEKPSTSEPSKGEVTPEEKPSAPEASKGEVTPEGKPSTPEPSKGEVQSKKEKASKKLPATGEKDTKILSAIGLGILAILGTYISRKKRSDS